MTCPNRPWLTGRVVSGTYAGWRVVVERKDPDLNDDMLVCYESPTGDEHFEDWVEDNFYFESYLKTRPWKIAWDT